ncbi:MAG: response regulator [Actinomycetota bacterium]
MSCKDMPVDVVSQKNNSVALVIIDDNPLSVEFVSAALERQGLKIFSAYNPREGLDLVYKHHPEFVITDLALPDMNGLEVLDRVKKFDPATKVVIITAYASKNSAEAARQKHAIDYLTKPIPLSLLRERIGGMIDEALLRKATRH